MRKRSDIEKDGTLKDILKLEVLLDIRDLLTPEKPKAGRPKGSKNKKIT